MAKADERLRRIEERLDALEQQAEVARASPEPTGPADRATSGDDVFWALDSLRERAQDWPGGGVLYAGTVELVPGERAEWQISHPGDAVAHGDWAEVSETLAALGNPVRLRLLNAVANGSRTTAELQELAGIGTAGQVYHHLRALTCAGWLRANGRGSWLVPPERLVPLLVVIAAARR